MKAMRWLLDVTQKLCPKRTQYSTILTVHRSSEVKYPDNVHWGRATEHADTVTITFQDIIHTCELDLKYSFTKVQGTIYYQRIGCPIGGYLSALYANTVCAYHEWQYTSSIDRNGIRTFGIRQMDDLVQWFAYKAGNKRSRKQALAMKRHMLKTNGVYKGGLKIEEQKVVQITRGHHTYRVHEFAGTEIHIRESDLSTYCRTLNKNKLSIEKGEGQQLIRYPPWETYAPRQMLRGVIIGSIHRIISQCASNDINVNTEDLIYDCLRENMMEHSALRYPTSFYASALRSVLRTMKTRLEIRDESNQRVLTACNALQRMVATTKQGT